MFSVLLSGCATPSVKFEETEMPEVEDLVIDFPEEEFVLIDPEGGGGDISVDFPNENVLTIIKNVAELYQLNIVIPEELGSYMIGIRMRAVDWSEVFDHCLSRVGYEWYQKDNVIYIVKDSFLFPIYTEHPYGFSAEQRESLLPYFDLFIPKDSKKEWVKVDVSANTAVFKIKSTRLESLKIYLENLDEI